MLAAASGHYGPPIRMQDQNSRRPHLKYVCWHGFVQTPRLIREPGEIRLFPNSGEPYVLGCESLVDNLTADLSIAKLARRAAMSPRNFARLFWQEMSKTPAKHIEDLRLEAARRQLESTSRSLDEVADASGFESAEILRRVFKHRLGVTPGQYRGSFGRAGIH